jgi:transposase
MAQAGRPPGTPKSGGRSKGTPNKNKQEFRELLDDAAKALGYKEGFDPLKKLTEIYFDLEKIGVETSGARVEILLKTLEYSYPKKKAVEVTGADGGPVEVDFQPGAQLFDKLAGISA